MKHKGKFFILITLCLICFLSISCKDRNLLSRKTIKIGAIYPLSGNLAKDGEDAKRGLDFAAEIINNSFNINIPFAMTLGLPAHKGMKIEIIYKDYKSDPNNTPALVEELVNNDHVSVIVGCYQSSATSLASEKAEMLNVPFINFDSTSPTLTQRGFKYFFRTTPDDEILAENFFTFLNELEKENKKINKNIVLVYENGLWGTGVAQAETKFAKKYNFNIVGDFPYDLKKENYDELVKQLKKFMPAIIMQSSYEKDAIGIVNNYAKYNIKPTAIMGMNAGFISANFIPELGDKCENILSRELWTLDLSDKKKNIEIINKLYFERYNKNMNGNSARNFTGLMVLADILNRTKKFTAEEIRTSILATNIPASDIIMPWDGVKFDEKTGQNILGKGIIVQIQNKSYVTVWPKEISKANIRW